MTLLKNTLLIALLIINTSCKKSTSGGEAVKAPSDLLVTANVSQDGSGNVVFNASAQNASIYDFEFGNGTIKTGTNGSVTYQYTQPGTITYKVQVTAKGANNLSIKKTVDIVVTVTAGTAGLVWSDEFNTDGAPDPNKWGYNIGTGDNGWGNQELEYYTKRPENVIIENGVLKINAIKENYMGSAYTSARLLSKGKFDFTYGTVEARAKLPTGVGTWPAIWMLGSNIDTTPWPACGEIDIMEHLGRDLNNIYGTFHYPGRFGGTADGGTRKIANATTEFHVYKLVWTASLMQVFVDDQLVHSLANSSAIPFNHNFFIIMNLAMGGNFAGAVDPSVTGATLEVDYIRVYK
ncbi:MAG TPA: family 16 glycosylhydrolase [Pelobium sp.]|nr:family 16 glycosylhydrolase [Pelobium sp.]